MQSSPLYTMDELNRSLPANYPTVPSVLGSVKSSSDDPFAISPVDYKTKCLNIVTEALRVVINHVHFSDRWPRIVFMCKKVDGKDATWHATDPNSRSEGYDIYHLAKHMSCGLNLKFYSNFLGISDFALSEYCNLFVALRNPLDHAPFLVTSSSVHRDSVELTATKNAIKKAIDFLTLMVSGPEVKQIVEIRVPLLAHIASLEEMKANLNEYAAYRQRQQNLKGHLEINEPYRKGQLADRIVQQLAQKIYDPSVQNMLVHIIGPRLNCSEDQVLESWFSASTKDSTRDLTRDSASHVSSPRAVQKSGHSSADSTYYDMFQAGQPPRNPSPNQTSSWEKPFQRFDPVGTKEWPSYTSSPPPTGIWSYEQNF